MELNGKARRPKRRLVCFILAFAMVIPGFLFLRGDDALLTVSAASADDFKNNSKVQKYQQQIAEYEKKAKELEKQISSLNSEISDLLEKKTYYDKLIEISDNKIEASEALLDELSAQIKGIDEDIAVKLDESDDLYERIKERMVVSYESGGSLASYVELIFGAKNLVDFLFGLENTVSIIEYDTNLMTDYKKIADDLKISRAAKEGSLLVQQELAEDLKAQLAQAESWQKKSENLLAQATADVKKNENALAEVEAKEKEADKELDAFIDDLIKKQGATQSVAEGEFMWPLETRYSRITSYFGNRKDPFGSGKTKNHQALDIYAPIGSKVYASNSGTVVKSVYSPSYGNYIIIDHGAKIFTLYAHCSKLLVKTGDRVEKGDLIAKTGVTGYVTGPHLHFEVREGSKRVNPLGYVKKP